MPRPLLPRSAVRSAIALVAVAFAGLAIGLAGAADGNYYFRLQTPGISAGTEEPPPGPNSFSVSYTAPTHATVGVGYVAVPTVTGAAGTPTFSASGLPSSFSIDEATGAVTGTPAGTEAGFHTVTITVADGAATAATAFSFRVSWPLVITGDAPDGAVGADYGYQFSLTGGRSPSVELASEALPPGLAVTPAGRLFGTPTLAGPYTFTLVASDPDGRSDLVGPMTVDIADGLSPVQVAGAWPSTCWVGEACSATFTASGGAGASHYVWSASPEQAAAGLGPSCDGLAICTVSTVFGTPATVEGVGMSVGDGHTTAFTAVGSIAVQVRVVISGAAPAAQPGATYVYTPTVAGGAGQKSFDISPTALAELAAMFGGGVWTFDTGTGTLASGDTLTASYSATQASLPTFTITVTDATGTSSVPVAVRTALTVSGTPASATVDELYEFVPIAVGGSGSATFAFSSQAALTSLGLAFDPATGRFSGTPTADGSVAGTLTVTDSLGVTATLPVGITVAPAFAISYPAMTTLTLGQTAHVAPTVVGGTVTSVVAVPANALARTRLFLDTNGTIGGTPPSSGTTLTSVTLRVQATTGSRTAVSDPFTLRSSPLIGGTPPDAKSGTAYNGGTAWTPTVAGGTSGSGHWTFTGGIAAGGPGNTAVVCQGLTFDATGIRGTAAAQAPGSNAACPASGTFSVSYTDAAGQTSNILGSLTVPVYAAPVVAATPAPPGGAVGTAYNGGAAWTPSVTGGKGPYSFAFSGSTDGAAGISGGTWNGLSFSSSGIAGTPAAAKTLTGFTVTATDVTGAVSAPVTMTLSILDLSASWPTACAVGSPCNATFTASGGTGPYTWVALSGTVPQAGVDATAMSDPSSTCAGSTCGVTWTPGSAQQGVWNAIVLTVRDAGGVTASRTSSFAVGAALAIPTQPSNVTGETGEALTLSTGVVASGGVGTRTWALAPSSAALPSGLTVETATGAIVGTTATATTVAGLKLRATDALGGTADTTVFSLNVTEPVGNAFAWGHNGAGQLGDGTATDRPMPTAVSDGHMFSQISASGSSHTCGVKPNGSAWCWGSNLLGRLGDGTTTNRSTPVAVVGGHVFLQISSGVFHTCGLRTDGSALCWGGNGTGQLGDGTTTDRSTPVVVSGGGGFTSIVAGTQHTCGRKSDGSAWCWGNNYGGQLGDGTTTHRNSPVAVGGGHAFSQISAGGGHTCGIKSNGTAWCWGATARGSWVTVRRPTAPHRSRSAAVMCSRRSVPAAFTPADSSRTARLGAGEKTAAASWATGRQPNGRRWSRSAAGMRSRSSIARVIIPAGSSWTARLGAGD